MPHMHHDLLFSFTGISAFSDMQESENVRKLPVLIDIDGVVVGDNASDGILRLWNWWRLLKRKEKVQLQVESEGSATHLDFDNDELTEVLGADKRNRTRGISSNLSTKQLKRTSIAKVMLAQARSSSNSEFKGEMSEMKSSIARVEGVLMDMLKLVTNNGMSNSQPPHGDTTPGTDVGSNSVRRSSQQNLMNMFESANPPVNPPVNPPANPPAETLSPPLKVILLGRDGVPVAGDML
ncbi:hypothetical protein IFM89_031531 [Coptis chinensis]|uniref:Uncharacterized protein n=1 Tax=Coptis chinensis TaxID=261450 RepID=A0A835IHP7_9MAGN|nr:hypothetical protein IFM89_031531 [Coptis chinensis]